MNKEGLILILLVSDTLSQHKLILTPKSQRKHTRSYITVDTIETNTSYTSYRTRNSADVSNEISTNTPSLQSNQTEAWQDFSVVFNDPCRYLDFPVSNETCQVLEFYDKVVDVLQFICLPVIEVWGIGSNILVIATLIERRIPPPHLSLIFLAGKK